MTWLLIWIGRVIQSTSSLHMKDSCLWMTNPLADTWSCLFPGSAPPPAHSAQGMGREYRGLCGAFHQQWAMGGDSHLAYSGCLLQPNYNFKSSPTAQNLCGSAAVELLRSTGRYQRSAQVHDVHKTSLGATMGLGTPVHYTLGILHSKAMVVGNRQLPNNAPTFSLSLVLYHVFCIPMLLVRTTKIEFQQV